MIGVPTKAKSATSLASGSRAIVIWYLMDRASFSSISALSRSPTRRWGSCWRLTAVVTISSKAERMPKSLSEPIMSRMSVRSSRRSMGQILLRLS
ncbi:hypothetical protein RHAL1_P00044 (plasmid) [Beijerinckiaceae bacterium RH AL1]|nr:hypothetical protein RHAL1_P00044 [Beijerinckiaceae bacterium RH AL1]